MHGSLDIVDGLESSATRQLTREQQNEQIAAAKAAGVTFFSLSKEDKDKMVEMSRQVYDNWADKIGKDYFTTVQTTLR